MNYRVDTPASISFHLQSELSRLVAIEDEIRVSGSIAPANCWIVEIEQRKGNRTYHYARLVSESKQVRSCSLGRPASSRHLDWQRRCKRRDMLAEIEQQRKMLIELIDRQTTHPIEFEYDHD